MAITYMYVFSVWIHLSLVHLLVSGQGIYEQKFYTKINSDCVFHDYLIGEELECTNGFPSMQDVQGQMINGINNFGSIQLIPDMNFTCSGTIVKVTVAGILRHRDSQNHGRLQIWRPENKTEGGIKYRRVKSIALSSSICKMFKMIRMLRDNINNNNITVYKCTLKKNKQIPVESGDILGVEPPREHNANFELYSITESTLTSYIFEHGLSFTALGSRRINESTAQPLIRIEVDPSRPGII